MAELNAMERVLLTLKGEATDRVPVCSLTVGVTRQLTGVSFPHFSTDSDAAAEAMLCANRLVGDDILLCFTDLSVEAADFGQRMIYPENTTAYPDYDDALIKGPDDYEKLVAFKSATGKRMSTYLYVCAKLVNQTGSTLPILGFVYGPLGVLGMMRGMEKLYLDILEYPDQVKIGLEIVTEVLTDFVKEQFARGVAGVCVDTLPASRSGVAPDSWEVFEGVYAQKISEAIRASGILLAHHGCGYAPYFKEVRQWVNPAVFSFAHLADDCTDFAEMKMMYGEDAVLMGFVPTELLYTGTAKAVMAECVRQIDLLGNRGRFILAPACEYPPNATLQNARAMVTAAEYYHVLKDAL